LRIGYDSLDLGMNSKRKGVLLFIIELYNSNNS